MNLSNKIHELKNAHKLYMFETRFESNFTLYRVIFLKQFQFIYSND